MSNKQASRPTKCTFLPVWSHDLQMLSTFCRMWCLRSSFAWCVSVNFFKVRFIWFFDAFAQIFLYVSCVNAASLLDCFHSRFTLAVCTTNRLAKANLDMIWKIQIIIVLAHCCSNGSPLLRYKTNSFKLERIKLSSWKWGVKLICGEKLCDASAAAWDTMKWNAFGCGMQLVRLSNSSWMYGFYSVDNFIVWNRY